MRSALKLAISIAIVAASAVALYRLAFMPVQCNREVARITRSSLWVINSGSNPRRITSVARQNIVDLERVASACPCDVNVFMLSAANASALGRYQDAVTYLDRALTVDDRPEIHFNRGQTLLDAGDLEGATRDLATAVTYDPNLAAELDPQMRALVTRRVSGGPG